MSINKTDVINTLYAYICDRMNHSNFQGGAPHGYGTGLQVNQELLTGYPNPPERLYVDRYTGLTIFQSEMVNAIRALAIAYGPAIRALYGVSGNWPRGMVTPPENDEPHFEGFAYDDYNIFFVNPAYHAGHYNQLVDRINTTSFVEMSGNVGLWGIQVFADRLWSTLIQARELEQPDLRICHSSCHSSCHSARGRR